MMRADRVHPQNKFRDMILFMMSIVFDIVIPQSSQKIPVLVYHSISEKKSLHAVSPKKFEQQMSYLHRRGYTTYTVLDLLSKEQLNKKAVLITFDDGFRDNLTTAKPILDVFGFVASIFISTDFIGGKSTFMTKEDDKTFIMLSREDLQILAQGGWNVGNHFATHTNLDTLSQEDVKLEFLQAQKKIFEMIGTTGASDIFAYPRSRTTPEIRTTLSSIARLGFGGENKIYDKVNDTQLLIPRITISNLTSFVRFKLIFSPSFNLLKQIFD